MKSMKAVMLKDDAQRLKDGGALVFASDRICDRFPAEPIVSVRFVDEVITLPEAVDKMLCAMVAQC